MLAQATSDTRAAEDGQGIDQRIARLSRRHEPAYGFRRVQARSILVRDPGSMRELDKQPVQWVRLGISVRLAVWLALLCSSLCLLFRVSLSVSLLVGYRGVASLCMFLCSVGHGGKVLANGEKVLDNLQ